MLVGNGWFLHHGFGVPASRVSCRRHIVASVSLSDRQVDIPWPFPPLSVFALAAPTIADAIVKEVTLWCTTVSVAAMFICVSDVFVGGELCGVLCCGTITLDPTSVHL